MDPLTPIACRVLGSLLEKERTVPATYPLTMNSLLTACNQTSGRDPILSLGPSQVEAAVRELRAARLAHVVYPSHGSRTEKVRQATEDALALDDAERAILTLLLLRGPQTPGELRTRSDRLHEFASLDEVAAALTALAGRDEPLVRQLPRLPGQKEQRWFHLLAGDEPPATAAAGPAATGIGVGSGAAPAAPSFPAPGPEIAPLAPFAGIWVGAGAGFYPTIEPFAYTEEIELRPIPGKPLLAYRSATRSADDGRPLHGESGFLRVAGDELVELVLAAGAGLVEIADALVDDQEGKGVELSFTSTLVAGTGTAKEVTATTRRYLVQGDVLTYELGMAAVGQPLLPHLQARLTRQHPA